MRLPGRRAAVSEILLAHEHYYHDLVYRDVETFADLLRTGDTAICEESYDVALEATGAVLERGGRGDARRGGLGLLRGAAAGPPRHGHPRHGVLHFQPRRDRRPLPPESAMA